MAELEARETNINLEGLYSEFDSKNKDRKEEFGGLIEKAKTNLADIENTYNNKLALQSSIQCWTKKRKYHSDAQAFAGKATAGLAFGAGTIFVIAAYNLLKTTGNEVDLWRVGVLLAISTTGIWATRLASKIFVSNLHLRTDADERVTMIQTYLALLREGSGPKDDERQLILQTLFRPSATGYIKDDGPTSFHDIAKSVLTKK